VTEEEPKKLTGPETNRDRAWRQGPGGEFIDPRKEQFAICRAKGMTIKASAQESRVNLETANKRWHKEPAMQERITALRRQNPTVAMGVGQILLEL
jgi:hypothetical protein